MRTSSVPCRKRILESSPPSSMMTSVPGITMSGGNLRRINFLNKGNMRTQRKPHAGGAGNAQPYRVRHAQPRYQGGSAARGSLRNKREVALIAGINDFVLFIEDNALDCSGTDIKSNAENFGHKWSILSSPCADECAGRPMYMDELFYAFGSAKSMLGKL